MNRFHKDGKIRIVTRCACHDNSYGMVINPTVIGWLDESYWTQDAITDYGDDIQQIHLKYQIDQYIERHLRE